MILQVALVTAGTKVELNSAVGRSPKFFLALFLSTLAIEETSFLIPLQAQELQEP
jgi:hypothetical protein